PADRTPARNEQPPVPIEPPVVLRHGDGAVPAREVNLPHLGVRTAPRPAGRRRARKHDVAVDPYGRPSARRSGEPWLRWHQGLGESWSAGAHCRTVVQLEVLVDGLLSLELDQELRKRVTRSAWTKHFDRHAQRELGPHARCWRVGTSHREAYLERRAVLVAGGHAHFEARTELDQVVHHMGAAVEAVSVGHIGAPNPRRQSRVTDFIWARKLCGRNGRAYRRWTGGELGCEMCLRNFLPCPGLVLGGSNRGGSEGGYCHQPCKPRPHGTRRSVPLGIPKLASPAVSPDASNP